MKKLRVGVAVLILVLVVLVLHSCRGGGNEGSTTEGAVPEIVNGVVSIPVCIADTRSDALRVAVYQPVGGGQSEFYDKVQACLGVSQEMLSRIKQLGSVGIPADDRLVLIAVDLQENSFRICGLAEQAASGEGRVPVSAMTCPSQGDAR